ncbi:hypothetical protein GPX89_30485 [Nocardia sp. ET3-3]|uniref:Uncharacterized protein n=1 Tax=Nocardia terrae TaxID=2675851 RepID=A0A7K1V4M2_9NOCA|nr:hypothetical protein [Nocardia terrae]MVU81556.1 hypothetical protein [Nocardia terrae]
MSESWIPLRRQRKREYPTAGRIRIALGAVAILVGTFTPLFSIDGLKRKAFTLLELGRMGAPVVPLMVVGATVLLVLGLLSDDAVQFLLPEGAVLRPIRIGQWLIALALAETLCLMLDLAIGFAVAESVYGNQKWSSAWLEENLPVKTLVHVKPALALLVLGPVLLLSGAFDRWRSAATSEE